MLKLWDSVVVVGYNGINYSAMATCHPTSRGVSCPVMGCEGMS